MICLFLDFVSVPNFLLSPSLLRSPLSFASQSTTQFVQKNLWNATQQFNKTLKGRKLSSNTSFKYDRQRLLSSLTFIFQKWSDPLSVWRSWSTSTNRSLEEHWTLKKTVSHTESEPGYGQVEDAAPRWFAGLLGFGREPIKASSSHFRWIPSLQNQLYNGRSHANPKSSPPSASRTRRTNEVPPTDAGSHFTRENTGLHAISNLQTSP
jgi:hypothetical protein